MKSRCGRGSSPSCRVRAPLFLSRSMRGTARRSSFQRAPCRDPARSGSRTRTIRWYAGSVRSPPSVRRWRSFVTGASSPVTVKATSSIIRPTRRRCSTSWARDFLSSVARAGASPFRKSSVRWRTSSRPLFPSSRSRTPPARSTSTTPLTPAGRPSLRSRSRPRSTAATATS